MFLLSYGVMVSTTAFGAVGKGSNPLRIANQRLLNETSITFITRFTIPIV